MRLGINYPFSYNRDGSDLGPDIWNNAEDWKKYNDLEAAGKLDSIPPPPLFDHLDRNLQNLNKMGISVVRWFILGNGTNYGQAPTPIPPKRTHFAFSPPSMVDKRYRRDFVKLLSYFKNVPGMQLLPSLIDFQFGSDLGALHGSGGPNGTLPGGRASVLSDPQNSKVFLDTVLAELLAASKTSPEQIFAWEVINEPSWLCSRFGELSKPVYNPRTPEVDDDQMSRFLTDACKRIKDAGFKPTVGHRYFSDLKRYPPGDFPQCHYYAEYSRVLFSFSDPPKVKDLFIDRPQPFIGEFDSALNRFGKPWGELAGEKNDSTLQRLMWMEHMGCSLAMIWPDLGGAKPDRVRREVLKIEQNIIDKYDVIKLLGGTRTALATYSGKNSEVLSDILKSESGWNLSQEELDKVKTDLEVPAEAVALAYQNRYFGSGSI